MDWNLLITACEKFDSPAPQFRRPTVHIVSTEQPITCHFKTSVVKRIEAFMYTLRFKDGTLQDYGVQ
jgi:hypothetical protein